MCEIVGYSFGGTITPCKENYPVKWQVIWESMELLKHT
jgi:hypothetical protein